MNKGIGNAIRKQISDLLPFNIFRTITTEVIMFMYDGLKYYKQKNGYYLTCKSLSLHRYIWEKKFGKIPKGYMVHHKDEDTENNHIDNLQLMTRKEHVSHHHKNKIVSIITKRRSSINQPTNIKVKCIETGIVYHSLSEAERKTGITTIKQWSQGRQLTAGGFHWSIV